MTSEDRKAHAPGAAPTGEALRFDDEKLRALMRLSSGVAHDLNNILQVVQTAVELVSRRIPAADDESTTLLQMAQRNLRRGTVLGRELLAFSGRQPLELANVNVNRLIADLAARLREAMGRNVRVETMLGGGLWPVRVDRGELETAILQLALNGRDAMASGGELRIETSNISLDGREHVAIAVSDEGAGMTPEVAAHACEPYFTTKDRGSSSGLGLSRVYGFVRQSGGSLDIDSRAGAGTRITIRLPRAGAVAEANVVPLGAAAPRARATRDLAGLRVLVAEDESLIGMLAEDLLAQLGCEMVGLVSTIQGALDLAQRTALDFALLDVDLGGEPSYPIAEALQAKRIPFAFMSGYGRLEGAWAGRPVIQKPFDLGQLRAEIERALSEAP